MDVEKESYASAAAAAASVIVRHHSADLKVTDTAIEIASCDLLISGNFVHSVLQNCVLMTLIYWAES